MAMDAMDKGKDVYLEKPMVHTNEDARQLVATVKETKRILQVGSQTTSADIWWKAKKAIADGMIGQMIMSQGSYHRNSIEGEWNYPIEAALHLATPFQLFRTVGAHKSGPGSQGRQSLVNGGGAAVTGLLEMPRKLTDQLGLDPVQRQLVHRAAASFGCKRKK